MTEKNSLQDVADRYFLEALDGWVDNRIGNALFIGASLPHLAARLAGQGISLMIVESDTERLVRFQQTLKNLGVDYRRVNVDPRPYEGIRFEASSYNLILAWHGLPAVPLKDLFKKMRRELKAGSNLYARIELRREDPLGLKRHLAKGPLAGLESLLDRINRPLERSLYQPDTPTMAQLEEAAEKSLKIEEVLYSGALLPRLLRYARTAADFPAPAGTLTRWLDAADLRLGGPATSPIALLKASKTLDMGRVFLTGSRFDPRYQDSV